MINISSAAKLYLLHAVLYYNMDIGLIKIVCFLSINAKLDFLQRLCVCFISGFFLHITQYFFNEERHVLNIWLGDGQAKTWQIFAVHSCSHTGDVDYARGYGYGWHGRISLTCTSIYCVAPSPGSHVRLATTSHSSNQAVDLDWCRTIPWYPVVIDAVMVNHFEAGSMWGDHCWTDHLWTSHTDQSE